MLQYLPNQAPPATDVRGMSLQDPEAIIEMIIGCWSYITCYIFVNF